MTRRHIDFLFGTCKDSAPFFTRSGDMQSLFNREETVMCSLCMEIGSACWYHASIIRQPVDDTELQLPPSDESKVGLD